MHVKNRPLSDEETARTTALLAEAPFGYLAMAEPDGPYVVPVNYAFVPDPGSGPGLQGVLYFHSGDGRKTAAIAVDPRVCMAFTAGVAFDQGPSPCADGFSYRSVLVWGQARLLEDRSEREAALRAIVAKYDPKAAETPFDEADFGQTLVYEVRLSAVSYKQQPRDR
jgi:nitroimidazol reductase NimA-like FMN-containing flavoprotein (pyridoxamine 5'-phosphate oxidase superfamily)